MAGIDWRNAGATVAWVPSAVTTNPTDGTVLCDSGPLDPGLWLFGITGETDSSIVFDIKAITLSQLLARRRPAAGDVDWLAPSQIRLPSGESVRVIIVGNPSAIVQLTLFGVWLG